MQPCSLVLTVIPPGRTALQSHSHEAEHVPKKDEEEEEEEKEKEEEEEEEEIAVIADTGKHLFTVFQSTRTISQLEREYHQQRTPHLLLSCFHTHYHPGMLLICTAVFQLKSSA